MSSQENCKLSVTARNYVWVEKLSHVIGVWGASERKTYVRVGAGAAVSLSRNLRLLQIRLALIPPMG